MSRRQKPRARKPPLQPQKSRRLNLAGSESSVSAFNPPRRREADIALPAAPSRAMHSRSRRLDEFRVEMLQPRHHFLLQQPQRIVPGLGLVLVVEAEHQQRAETADLAVDGLDLLGYRRRRADDPVVAGAVFDRHVAVRYVGRVVEIILEAEVTEQRQEGFT